MGKGKGLHLLELKALSVPSSLRFLLGVEYDVVLCVTEVGNRRSCTIRFPTLAVTFQKLLELCAERFGLVCTHHGDHSILSGTAMMPTLRYVDYLPGALHMVEILDCLGVTPSSSSKRCEGSPNAFLASFIDYSEYCSDASLADVHGTGFYLMLDYGLSTATHSHLVEIRFHKGWQIEEVLREFEEFSGWSTFDLRFDDENDKLAGGVIVMPSIQDACDLFEKYEDEDSDDEGDLLPFVLRPVSPLVPVPSVEDSSLKKLRDQHWGEVEKFWERFSKWRNCVVVSNLYESASLEEALAFFEGLPITASALVEDGSPTRRRRVFATFATAESARKALLLDGRSTKGKTLRVQVSPPYLDESRRGRVVGSLSTSSSELVLQQKQHAETSGNTPPLSPPVQEQRDGASGSHEVTAPPGKEKDTRKNADDKRRNTPVVQCSAAPANSGPVSTSPVSNPNLAPAAGAAKEEELQQTLPSPVISSQPTQCNPPLVASTMNANAREFFPSTTFHVNTKSPEYYPSTMPAGYMGRCIAPPPAYSSVTEAPVSVLHPMGTIHRSPRLAAAPPPYTAPPPYSVATAHVMHAVHQPPPPPM